MPRVRSPAQNGYKGTLNSPKKNLLKLYNLIPLVVRHRYKFKDSKSFNKEELTRLLKLFLEDFNQNRHVLYQMCGSGNNLDLVVEKLKTELYPQPFEHLFPVEHLVEEKRLKNLVNHGYSASPNILYSAFLKDNCRVPQNILCDKLAFMVEKPSETKHRNKFTFTPYKSKYDAVYERNGDENLLNNLRLLRYYYLDVVSSIFKKTLRTDKVLITWENTKTDEQYETVAFVIGVTRQQPFHCFFYDLVKQQTIKLFLTDILSISRMQE